MLAWLQANLATILILVVLATIVAAIIAHLIRNRRKGKSSCGCACQSCPMEGACHSEKK